MHQKNFLASCDGNLSVRESDTSKVFITRSGIMKGLLKPEDIITVSLNGELIDSKAPNAKPSSELAMHLAIYKNQPLAKAVVHAHPPSAIAFSVVFPEEKWFPLDYISELRLALGEVPIVCYQRPGTKDMGMALVPFLCKAKVMILARHGVVAWGEDLQEAYRGIERLEHACDIYLKARALGHVKSLPDEEVEALKKMREEIGFKTL